MFRRLFGGDREEPPAIDGELRPLQFEPIPVQPPVSEPERLPVEWSFSGHITTNAAGDLEIRIGTIKEARQVLKELRLRKKAFNAEKRLVTQEMTAVRRKYTVKHANRGPSIRGGGSFGTFVRSMDQLSRASDRSSREAELEPLVDLKQEYELAVHAIDGLIHQCDAYIVQQQLEDDAATQADLVRACASCGETIDHGDKFCPSCGTTV